MPDRYHLDIDESAIYEGERCVVKLDTGGGREDFSNDNWRLACALGARIVELLNDSPPAVADFILLSGKVASCRERDGHRLPDGQHPLYAVAPTAARAFDIADEAMFELLQSEGCLSDGIDSTVIGFVDEGCAEVHALAQACPAMREAFEWLQPRGYVELGTDTDGEFINVVRRPGEDA